MIHIIPAKNFQLQNKLLDMARHTLQSGPGSRLVDPRPLDKVDALQKLTVRVKNSVLTNWRVLVSNMTIVIQNSS